MFISFRIWRNKLKLFLNHLTAYIASEFNSQRTLHSSCSSRELCQLYLTTKVAFLYLFFDRHFFWLYLYFFFTSFHLSEYTYWFVISVNKGTSQCICSKKFYFPIRTLPLDSSLHNYKKNAVFAILNLIWTIVKKSWPGLSNCIHLSRKLRKKTFFIARQFLAKLVFFRMGEKKWDKNKTTKSKNYWTVSFSVYWLTNFNDLF